MESRFKARLGKVKVDLATRSVDTAISVSRAVDEQSWDIIHFLGHGEVRKAAGGELAGGLLIAKGENRQFLSAAGFGAMLQGRQTRLVILSACVTGQAQVKSQFGNLASYLVRQNVPAVIANQMVITAESPTPPTPRA